MRRAREEFRRPMQTCRLVPCTSTEERTRILRHTVQHQLGALLQALVHDSERHRASCHDLQLNIVLININRVDSNCTRFGKAKTECGTRNIDKKFAVSTSHHARGRPKCKLEQHIECALSHLVARGLWLQLLPGLWRLAAAGQFVHDVHRHRGRRIDQLQWDDGRQASGVASHSLHQSNDNLKNAAGDLVHMYTGTVTGALTSCAGAHVSHQQPVSPKLKRWVYSSRRISGNEPGSLQIINVARALSGASPSLL